MKYRVITTKKFNKKFKKLDKPIKILILKWINKNLNGTEDPRQQGKALVENLRGYWRYRIGDYRLLCEIQDEKLIIVALNIGHRSEIYKS